MNVGTRSIRGKNDRSYAEWPERSEVHLSNGVLCTRVKFTLAFGPALQRVDCLKQVTSEGTLTPKGPMKSLYCFIYILTSKQKKVNFRHSEDTQRYFNRPLGENKIGEEYPSAGHNVANLSVRKASIRSLLDANIS